jgi:hypothetical protein
MKRPNADIGTGLVTAAIGAAPISGTAIRSSGLLPRKTQCGAVTGVAPYLLEHLSKPEQ